MVATSSGLGGVGCWRSLPAASTSAMVSTRGAFSPPCLMSAGACGVGRRERATRGRGHRWRRLRATPVRDPHRTHLPVDDDAARRADLRGHLEELAELGGRAHDDGHASLLEHELHGLATECVVQRHRYHAPRVRGLLRHDPGRAVLHEHAHEAQLPAPGAVRGGRAGERAGADAADAERTHPVITGLHEAQIYEAGAEVKRAGPDLVVRRPHVVAELPVGQRHAVAQARLIAGHAHAATGRPGGGGGGAAAERRGGAR